MNDILNNESPVRWSTLGIIGSIVVVVIASMWTVSSTLNTLVDKLEATDHKISQRIILLEDNQITQERLIEWEVRFTSIDKDVTQLINRLEKNCNREVSLR